MTENQSQIKEAFEAVASHVKIDAGLAKRIADFQISFVNKNNMDLR